MRAFTSGRPENQLRRFGLSLPLRRFALCNHFVGVIEICRARNSRHIPFWYTVDMNLKDDPRAYAIMGCAMRVHRTLGFGFLESAYGDALEIEFRRAGIPFVREDAVKILYAGQPLRTTYRADFTCHDRGYLVELKAIKSITKAEWAQVIHYLRATRIPHALLLNFGRPQLQYDTFDLDSLPQASVIATAADPPAKPVGGESETRSAGHSAER